MCTLIIADSVTVGIHVIPAVASVQAYTVVQGTVVADAISIGIRIHGAGTVTQADPRLCPVCTAPMRSCGKSRCRSDGQNNPGCQHSQYNSFHNGFLPIVFQNSRL